MHAALRKASPGSRKTTPLKDTPIPRFDNLETQSARIGSASHDRRIPSDYPDFNLGNASRSLQIRCNKGRKVYLDGLSA
jgi:hypothetical protein